MARYDERYRRRLGGVGVGLAHQRRGHVTRAVLHVQAARDLDFLHLFARRNGHADLALDDLVFLMGRVDEVEPNGVVRDVGIRRDRNAVERCAARNVDPQHDSSASPSAL